MQYFKNIPTIEYLPTNFPVSAKVKNLFYTLDLIVNDDNFIQLYVIEGIKRLDNISYELYKSTDHWWILAKLNNITDIIYDLPIEEAFLQRVALDRTLAHDDYDTIDDPGAMEYYITQFDELVIENDNKRQINVIKPEYLSIVLAEIVKSL